MSRDELDEPVRIPGSSVVDFPPREQIDMRRAGASRVRWIIAGGAILMAAIALYVLLNVGGGPDGRRRLDRPGVAGPALDEIDAKSRSALRDVLRNADERD